MANYTVPLWTEKTKILKQDSFREVIAVCEWVDNSESFPVGINQKTKLPITIGDSHCIILWIQRKELRLCELWLKPEAKFGLKSGSGIQKQGSRHQMSEGDEVTLWAWRKQRPKLAGIKAWEALREGRSITGVISDCWDESGVWTQVGAFSPFPPSIELLLGPENFCAVFPFLPHHLRAGLFHWFIQLATFIQYPLLSFVIEERDSNWKDRVLPCRTQVYRGMEIYKRKHELKYCECSDSHKLLEEGCQ